MPVLIEALEALTQEVCQRISQAELPMRPWWQPVPMKVGQPGPVGATRSMTDGRTMWYFIPESRLDVSRSPILYSADGLTSLGAVVEAIEREPAFVANLQALSSDVAVSDIDTRQSWVFDKLVQPFLWAYFHQVMEARFDEQVFRTLANQVLVALQSQTRTIVKLTPLVNITLSQEVVELAPGLKLRRIDPAEAVRWFNYFGDSRWAQEGTNILYAQAVVELTLEITDNDFSTASESNQIVDSLLTALRLVINHNVFGAFTWIQMVRIGNQALFELESNRTLPSPGVPRTLDSAQVQQLSDLWARLQTIPNANKVALAIERWNSAFERSKNEDKLIDYWVALEALFAPENKPELSLRVSLRMAGFFGTTPVERLRIFDEIRHSYNWRSIIVHGSDERRIKRLQKVRDLPTTTMQTRDYLRRAILRILEADQTFNAKGLERAVFGVPQDASSLEAEGL